MVKIKKKECFYYSLFICILITFLEINQCPFIELLSFGSNIDIKCNETYLIFNETNVRVFIKDIS